MCSPWFKPAMRTEVQASPSHIPPTVSLKKPFVSGGIWTWFSCVCDGWPPPVHPNSHPVAHEHLPQSPEYTNLQPCKKDVCVPVVLLQSLQDKLQRKNAPRPLAICPSEAGWVSAWVCLLPSSLLYIPTPTPTPAPIYLAYIQAIKHACPAPHFHSAYVKYIAEMSWSPGEMTESATDHNETLPLACMWRKREDGEER